MAGTAAWIDVLPNLSAFGAKLDKGVTVAATSAGKTAGKRFSDAMNQAAGKDVLGEQVRSLQRAERKAEQTVRQCTAQIAKSRDEQQTADLRLQAAETKLAETVAKYGASSSQAITAQARLNDARSKARQRTEAVRSAEEQLKAAQTGLAETQSQLSSAQHRASTATSGFRSALQRWRQAADAAKASTSGLSEVQSRLGDTSRRMAVRFGVMAGAVGGFASSIASKAVSSFMSLGSSMVDASDSAQKFASTMSFAGVDDKTIAKLTKSTQDYADRTVFDLSDIRNTTSQLASNGVKNYDKLAEAGYKTVDEALNDPAYHHIAIHAESREQSQVHIETCVSYCYMEGNKIVCVSSTQIPHVVRRVIGQALGIPWGDVRVIKPYIGGGFGTKQDVHYEPLNAWVCKQIGGRCVKMELTREELFWDTSGRQPKTFDIECSYGDDMALHARKIVAYSNTGGYIHHGHALVLNSVNSFRWLYHNCEVATHSEAYTIHTNGPHTGAMRAYGVPEGNWAAECLMGDIAYDNGWDGVEFRLKNVYTDKFVDEFTPGGVIAAHTCAIPECVEKGKAYIEWDRKKKEYANETGPIRHGVGVAFFVYKTAVAPFALETATAQVTLNQDGSVQLQMGATEIGQGADTVFSQMAAEAIGIDTEDVHIVSQQDTDVTPYDSGAYASRQTYVSGTAVKKAGETLRKKILDYARYLSPEAPGELDLRDHAIWDGEGNKIWTLPGLALEAYYNLNAADQLSAHETVNVHTNTIAGGVTFADVTVDMPLGQVTVNKIINVQDSGRLINPKLVEQQIHGGMAQGIGYGLYEELQVDPKTARVLNPTLLDYKIPTTMDVPDLKADFVEKPCPTGPYGNKAVGETPVISPAAAIRDAILDATGVKFYVEPMTPQRLFEGFKEAGLI